MTDKISKGLIQIAGLLIIAVTSVASVHAQNTVTMPMARPTPAPLMQNLTGVIRVPKAFGIMPTGPGVNKAGAPCGQFYVAALDPDKGNRYVASTSASEPGRDDGEFYTCKYTLTLPTNKSLYVIAGMGGVLLLPKQSRDPVYITDAWIGGSNNKPRRGYERGFAGKFVTLEKAHPSYLRFDMYYAQVDPN